MDDFLCWRWLLCNIMCPFDVNQNIMYWFFSSYILVLLYQLFLLFSSTSRKLQWVDYKTKTISDDEFLVMSSITICLISVQAVGRKKHFIWEFFTHSEFLMSFWIIFLMFLPHFYVFLSAEIVFGITFLSPIFFYNMIFLYI